MKTEQLYNNVIESGFSPRVQSQSTRRFSFSSGNITAVSGTLSDFLISNPIIIDETSRGDIKCEINGKSREM